MHSFTLQLSILPFSVATWPGLFIKKSVVSLPCALNFVAYVDYISKVFIEIDVYLLFFFSSVKILKE